MFREGTALGNSLDLREDEEQQKSANYDDGQENPAPVSIPTTVVAVAVRINIFAIAVTSCTGDFVSQMSPGIIKCGYCPPKKSNIVSTERSIHKLKCIIPQEKCTAKGELTSYKDIAFQADR